MRAIVNTRTCDRREVQYSLVRRICFTLVAVISITVAESCLAANLDPMCGRLDNNYAGRPFDFRTAPNEQRRLVERHHFDIEHGAVSKGKTAVDPIGPVGGGLDYTLRVWPNHHPALADVDKVSIILKTDRIPGASVTVKCYFERAIYFAPDDGMARVLYGFYHLRRGSPTEAVAQLGLAEQLLGENANVAYNLGLAYFDLKDYEKARNYAKRAYELGFPLPGLRDKLTRAGQWK